MSTLRPFDYRPMYQWLLDRYATEENCPALLFTDKADGDVFWKTPYGEKAIFLGNTKGCRLNDLKKAYSRAEMLMPNDRFKEQHWDKLWDPTADYKSLYTAYLEISDYLKTPMPPIFFTYEMPTTHRGDCIFQNKDLIPTNVFINTNTFSIQTILTSLLHELRHVWQLVYHPDWWDDRSGHTESSEEYLSKFVEVDAFAFELWNTKNLGLHYSSERIEKNAAVIKRVEELEKNEVPLTTLSSLEKLSKTLCVAGITRIDPSFRPSTIGA